MSLHRDGARDLSTTKNFDQVLLADEADVAKRLRCDLVETSGIVPSVCVVSAAGAIFTWLCDVSFSLVIASCEKISCWLMVMVSAAFDVVIATYCTSF